MSQPPTQDLTTAAKGGAPIGRWLWVVIGLTAMMTYRFVTVAGLADLGEGTPDFWVVAITGDVFMGLTAPIVAFLVWKTRGLGIWTVAIVWNAIGIKDYLAGSQFLRLGLPEGGAPLGVFVAIFAIGISAHLLCIFLMVHFRGHWLKQPERATT